MTLGGGRWERLSRLAQIGLVIVLVCVDFAHGIALHEHQVGFHPVYRVRQSVAVALSRMREPPAKGYLAYGSVVDALSRNGYSVFDADRGPHFDLDAWHEFFNDPARMDHALQEARDVAIDPKLPMELIKGNELAYADYIYDSFRLFGIHTASFYYFYFLILTFSCALFVLQFRDSRFCMLILAAYLAELFLIENYAQSFGDQLNTVSNSRLFEALSLLPAMHIFLAVWRRTEPRRLSWLIVALQSALLGFLVVCRITAAWQVAMIAFSALGLGFADWWTTRAAERRPLGRLAIAGWPAIVAVVVLGVNMAAVGLGADRSYSREPKYHLYWHEILRGVLASSEAIRREYLHGRHSSDISDQDAYDVVMDDLTARHDMSSPIAFADKGKIYIDIGRSYGAYEQLARSMSLRIIRDHPLEFLGGFYRKAGDQLALFIAKDSLSFANLFWPILIAAAGVLIWAIGERLDPISPSAIARGACATFVLLAFASATPAIVPSPLSVGTLMAYTAAFVIALVYSVRVGLGLILRRGASESIVCNPETSGP
jgi:hypothetical protein